MVKFRRMKIETAREGNKRDDTESVVLAFNIVQKKYLGDDDQYSAELYEARPFTFANLLRRLAFSTPFDNVQLHVIHKNKKKEFYEKRQIRRVIRNAEMCGGSLPMEYLFGQQFNHAKLVILWGKNGSRSFAIVRKGDWPYDRVPKGDFIIRGYGEEGLEFYYDPRSKEYRKPSIKESVKIACPFKGWWPLPQFSDKPFNGRNFFPCPSPLPLSALRPDDSPVVLIMNGEEPEVIHYDTYELSPHKGAWKGVSNVSYWASATAEWASEALGWIPVPKQRLNHEENDR